MSPPIKRFVEVTGRSRAAIAVRCSILVIVVASSGCGVHSMPPVQRDVFVEFRSKSGDRILAPSEWAAEEDEHGWYLSAPDKRALISIHAYPREKVKSVEQLQTAIVNGTTRNTAELEPSEWNETRLGKKLAWRRELVPTSYDAEREWRVFALEGSGCFYAIIVHASPTIMHANGAFYESIVATFEGEVDADKAAVPDDR